MKTSKLEKMAKKLPILIGLLVAQLSLAIVLFNVNSSQTKVISEPLVDLESVDQVDITTDTGETLKITLGSQGWTLDNQLPVSQGKMAELLTMLKAARTGWPIATTAEAAQQLKVGDQQFRRKLSFAAKGKALPSLLIGTSPSFKSSHVRKQGAQDIHSLDIDEYFLTADPEAWLNAYFLRLEEKQIIGLQIGGHALAPQDGTWPTPPRSASALPNTASFNSAEFVKSLVELEILGLVSSADAQKLTEMDAEWTVKTPNGDKGYKIAHNGDDYYLQRDDFQSMFRISKAVYDVFMALKTI